VLMVVYCLQLKKNDILSNSIQTRSKAHNIIKRMLTSLGDPYTRFLSPEEVIHSSIFNSVALWRFFFLSLDVYALWALALPTPIAILDIAKNTVIYN
jgi:hypothetical protein